MPKNKKVLAQWLQQVKVYGLNAVLGFGLGVAIVLFILTIGGKVGTGTETRGIVQSEAASPTAPNQGLDKEVEDKAIRSEEQMSSGDVENRVEQAISDRFTVLLVGIDNRPDEKFTSNTDSIIIASLDQKHKKMVLLSIPRDTQVLLPSQKKEKINALARLGEGIPSTQKYIEELIGNPINGYILSNFQGFKNIVDSLGGITVNVEKNMYYDTGDKKDRYIDLKKGIQRLNGSQALQYARFRNDELADITRTARQQEVLKALVTEATSTRNLPKIPFLIPKVYQSIETDLNLSQLWALAMALKNREGYEIVNQTLPGKFSIEEGISYWKVDPSDSKQILSKLFQGKKPPVFEYTYSKNKSTQEGRDSDQTELKSNQSSEVESKMTSPRVTEGIKFEVLGP